MILLKNPRNYVHLMVLDDLSVRERRGVAAAFAVAIAAAFATGYVGSGMAGTPSGAITADTGDAASEDEITQQVQSLMDQQLSQQQAQFEMMAGQNPNMSAEDLSMEASVTDVSESEFGGLYAVTVSTEGQMPGQQGGLQQVDEEQTVYISTDGQYLFPEPTDLEQAQQPAQQPLQ